MVDANLVRRRRFWWPVLAAAALLLALGIGMVTREDGGADGEPAADADAEDGTVTVAESLAADALVEPGEPAAQEAQPFGAGRAFMRDCAEPEQARRRIQVEHLFEAGCLGQLSAALGGRVGAAAPAEARAALQRYRAAVDSVERGPWESREQADRMRQALLSAADVLEALAYAQDGATPAADAAAEARKSAASIRAGLPVAEQPEPVDAFFRNAGEALRQFDEQRD